jgi:hypothetical protein
MPAHSRVSGIMVHRRKLIPSTPFQYLVHIKGRHPRLIPLASALVRVSSPSLLMPSNSDVDEAAGSAASAGQKRGSSTALQLGPRKKPSVTFFMHLHTTNHHIRHPGRRRIHWSTMAAILGGQFMHFAMSRPCSPMACKSWLMKMPNLPIYGQQRM